MRLTALFAVLLMTLSLTGCPEEGSIEEETILLTIENRSGLQIWYFQYRACGATDEPWIEVIEDDEYLADGSDLSSIDLEPGCYDLYVEDELGCTAENSTDGNLAAGLEFTWTVLDSDFVCP